MPDASADAAELAAIKARLSDRTRERRYARQIADRHSDLSTVPAVDNHAAALRRLATSGVLYGPDVSQFQGTVHWGTVRASGCVLGAYKVSEGRTYQDPQHQMNRAHAPAAGLIPLAYHYLYYSAEYVRNPVLWGAQADWYCSLVDPHAIHALDVEDAAPTPGLGVRQWVAAYRRHYPSKPLLIYSNRGMWVHRSRVTAAAADLPGTAIWHAGIGDGYYTPARGAIAAEYAATGALRNSMAALGWPTCSLWQITDHAQVPGVAGTCDGNAFLGTLEQLRALTGTTVTPAEPEDDMPLSDDDIAKVAAAAGRAFHSQQIYRVTRKSDGKPYTVADALLAIPSAQAIADALVAKIQGLPAVANGSTVVDQATIAALAKATVDEMSSRLVK